MLDVSGFQVLYSQVLSVSELFMTHPDIAGDFKPRIQQVKTAYMSVILGLIETLNKPPHSLTETELSNAQRELIELAEAGFKLDWLDRKLDDVCYERSKTANADGDSLEDWLKGVVHSWNDWKVRVGFARLPNSED